MTEFATQLRELLKLHVPSLSPEDEDIIFGRTVASSDAADWAIRTCSCGVRVDGYYAFVDHLLDEAGAGSLCGCSVAPDFTAIGGTVWR